MQPNQTKPDWTERNQPWPTKPNQTEFNLKETNEQNIIGYIIEENVLVTEWWLSLIGHSLKNNKRDVQFTI